MTKMLYSADIFSRARLLGGAALAALLAAGTAQAQTGGTIQADSKAGDLVEVVVTGSRIRGGSAVGAEVGSVSHDDIIASGALDTFAAIEKLPSVFNLGVSENSRSQATGAANITYGSGVNLRGLGPYATLTLFDGHRAVPQGTAGQALDPSVVPSLAMDRVEVVADGASALYGSDAVAGVVNLIPNKNFEGVETSVRFGAADSYWEKQLGIIAGHGWGTGHAMVSFENSSHSALSGNDRSFYTADLTGQGGGDFRAQQCNPGNITAGGATYAIPAGGVAAATSAALKAGTLNKCDPLKAEDLLPQQNRKSGVFALRQEVNDWLTLKFDGFASERTFRFRAAPTAGTVDVPSTNPYFTAPPGINAASETVDFSLAGLAPSNDTSGYSRAFQGYAGFDVSLPHDWMISGSWGQGMDQDQSVSVHGLDNGALGASLNSANPATAFNPFGGANSPAVLSALTDSLFLAPGRTIFSDAELKADGPLFRLPGGDVRLAAGMEWQHTSEYTGLDGGTVSDPFSLRSAWARHIISGYGEALIPLVGSDNAMPFIQKLAIDLSGRIDSYSDVGETSNPKIGVDWKPVSDLKLRGTYGTSFRAPLLSENHSVLTGLFIQNYSDPTKGGAITQGVALSGATPGLKPETATTYTAGADYSPSFLPQAQFKLTYFDVDYQNQITSYLSDLTILNRENQFGSSGVIVRNPSAAFLSQYVGQYPVFGVLPPTIPLFVDGRTKNLGKTVARGLDFTAVYDFPHTGWGDFTWGIDGTYYIDYDVAITPASPLINQVNKIYNPLQFRFRSNLAWTFGEWSAVAFLNYENSYTNNLAVTPQSVSPYTTVDLHVGYQPSTDWAKHLKFAIDVTNLFDAAPPFVNIAESPNGGGGFDPTATNPIGRIVMFSVGTKF